ARRDRGVAYGERTRQQRATVLVKPAAPVQFTTPLDELRQRLFDRVGDEVEGDVVDRVEAGATHVARRPTGRRRHPPLPERDAAQRKLFRHVIELVPLVVAAVLGG